MCDIPLELLADEKLVRAVKTPYHLKKNKRSLQPAAFRPPPERDDLSVMRLDYMGADACKAKAKEISAENEYVGLAAINADQVHKVGATVVDSREGQFCGHAHISQGVPYPEKGKAVPPELATRYKNLADAARLYIDPEPDNESWTGPLIV